jgi:tRNA G18 (ribose-2'-O)-methylase SpoU
LIESLDVQAQAVSFFYRCEDKRCGLRFPVGPGDRFGDRCPRCGGSVAQVGSGVRSDGGELPEQTSGPRLELLLDNWRSLFNVGAAFRTADGVGVSLIHLCGITPTPVQPKLAKTALGAEQVVAWRYALDAVACAAALQATGAHLWVLEGTAAAESLFESLPGSAAGVIVLAAGNEVSGVDPGLLALADRVVRLPMLGQKRSLNVAVALSIAAYWLRGQTYKNIRKCIGSS